MFFEPSFLKVGNCQLFINFNKTVLIIFFAVGQNITTIYPENTYL